MKDVSPLCEGCTEMEYNKITLLKLHSEKKIDAEHITLAIKIASQKSQRR